MITWKKEVFKEEIKELEKLSKEDLIEKILDLESSYRDLEENYYLNN